MQKNFVAHLSLRRKQKDLNLATPGATMGLIFNYCKMSGEYDVVYTFKSILIPMPPTKFSK